MKKSSTRFFSACDPIVPTSQEAEWGEVMKAVFYAYDSLCSRELSLGVLSRFFLI